MNLLSLSAATMRPLRLLASLLLLALLHACAGAPRAPAPAPTRPGGPMGEGPTSSSPDARKPPPASTARRPGGFYQDDGPGGAAPDIDSIPDAQPRLEPLAPRANRPYTVFGIQYIPLTQLKPYRERGVASWYGRKFHGQPTSTGERYDMYAMTAAHPTLPLPSYVRVTNPRNGKSVVVRVNDRGPFLHNRIIDLSWTAAAKLGYVNAGSTEVEVELIDDPVRYAARGNGGSVPAEGVVLAAATPANTPATPAAAAPRPAGSPAGTTASAKAATESGVSGSSAGAKGNAAAPPGASTTSGAATGAGAGTLSPPAGAAGSTAASGTSAPPGTAATGTTPAASSASGERRDSTAESAPLVLTRETVVSPGPGGGSSGLYLQLGAFSARESADATRLRLEQQYPWMLGTGTSRTEVVTRAEGGLFKLQLGPFRSRNEAMASVERLRSESGLQAFVVTR